MNPSIILNIWGNFIVIILAFHQAVPSSETQEDHPVLSTEEQKREMNRRKRVVMKGGITNVSYKNISKKRRRYISDLFTTLLGRRHFVFYTTLLGWRHYF
jgi:hypothetical protein